MVEKSKRQLGKLLSVLLMLAVALLCYQMMASEEAMAAKAENLLDNPGAETGNLAGWTDPSKEKCWMVGREGKINGWSHPGARSGKYYFMTGWPSESDAERILYQDVNIPVSDGGIVTFGGYLGGYGHNDEGGIRLELLNSKGKVISSQSSKLYSTGFGNWDKYVEVSLKTTKAAVTARASLIGVLNEGDEADAYFDDLSLTVKAGKNGDPENIAQVKGVKLKNKKVRRIYAYFKSVRNIHGYQARYSMKKNMKGARTSSYGGKGAKMVIIKDPKIKKGKTYYVQIRAYRVTGTGKVFGKWSDKKSIKINQ